LFGDGTEPTWQTATAVKLHDVATTLPADIPGGRAATLGDPG
jgi:hypothetical protein